ncbi:MAG: SDR family NAD(P)-dependent oxidoreductase [Bacteroidetes bacterium]|nr:SDR family NAD(P)-dependent oxidoreductase [Bacteroidota bacterium]
MPLKDKVVLITGASSGIGAAAAIAFSRAGAKVAVAARRAEKLEEVSKSLRDPLILIKDISVETHARQMVDDTVAHFGQIDILINNAACIIVSPAETVLPADMIKAFNTNLIGPMVATQQALKYMRRQGGGHIINVGSPGFMMGIPFYAPYVCSKAAFSAWTRTLQSEWANSEIIVSEYFPGYIKTDSKPESRVGDVEQDLLMKADQNFISRLFTKSGTAEEVAHDLVNLALRPKTLVYSGFAVRLGAWIANFSSFRLKLAKDMARTARMKIERNMINK